MTSIPPRVARLTDGRIAFLLTPQERLVIGGYLAGLTDRMTPPIEALGDEAAPPGDDAVPPRDPVLERLYPDAVPTDPVASASFRDLVVGDLVDDRLARLATVLGTIDATPLDDADAAAWLGALNDLRLVLGTDLGVTEDDPDEIDEEDPDAEARLVYGYAAWLQGQLVDVLSDALPDVEEDG